MQVCVGLVGRGGVIASLHPFVGAKVHVHVGRHTGTGGENTSVHSGYVEWVG